MAPPESDRSLEDLALQQLGYIDVIIIAEQDQYNNQQIPATPLTLVSDPFWEEFNNWRINNPDDYNEWYQNLPRSDNADPNDDQEATGDNAPPRKKKTIDDNDDDTSNSDETESGESSSYATTLTITGTGSSTSVQSDYSSTTNGY